MSSMELLISGYGTDGNESIGLAHIDKNKVKWHWKDRIDAPSYLSGDGEYLFAVTEVTLKCILHMYRRIKNSYELIDRFSVPIGGVCHLYYMSNSGILLCSSYEEGVIFSVEVNGGGFVGMRDLIRQTPGDGIESRVHCAIASKDESKVYVTNITEDKLYMYNCNKGVLSEQATLSFDKHTGPRHLVLSNDEKKLYLITEYSNQIVSIGLNGRIMEIYQSLNLLPQSGVKGCAGSSICMTEDGRYIYAAVRGIDHIFKVKIHKDGVMATEKVLHSGGSWPRHIALVDGDTRLAIANQKSNEVVLMPLDDDFSRNGDDHWRIAFENVSFVS